MHSIEKLKIHLKYAQEDMKVCIDRGKDLEASKAENALEILNLQNQIENMETAIQILKMHEHSFKKKG